MILVWPIGVYLYDSLIEPAKWCAKLRSLLPDSSKIVLDCKMGSGMMILLKIQVISVLLGGTHIIKKSQQIMLS